MDLVSIKCTKILESKILQNLPKFRFLVFKTNHLATLFSSREKAHFFLSPPKGGQISKSKQRLNSPKKVSRRWNSLFGLQTAHRRC
jgi:hypothetical protein